MGIYNLKTNLESIESLKKVDEYSLEKLKDYIKYNYIFLDFNCLFYTYAHVSISDADLYNKLLKALNYLLKYISNKNKLYIFYDSGYIKKKVKENEKRKIHSTSYYDNLKQKIIKDNNMNNDFKIKVIEPMILCVSMDNKSTQTLESSKNYNDIGNVYYECTTDNNSVSTQIIIRESIQYYIYEDDLVYSECSVLTKTYNIEYYKNCDENLIQKKIYSIQFNLESNKKTNALKQILHILKENKFNLLTEKNIDAEVYMIKKAVELYNTEKEWPIFHTKDQDVIALLVFNSPCDTYILFNDSKYKISIHDITKKIVLLNLIFNYSDYFGGINGYSLDINKCKQIISNKEFIEFIIDYYSIEDIKKICSLAINITKNKSIKLTNVNTEVITKYLNEIILYLHFDGEFYKTTYNNSIKLYDFINYLRDS
ncbi:FEN1-like nuclease [Alphaentomopoxvirus acuprea]|uniref:FEN1-like nuclease n=1 Tax=Alphaentomopoxvirus acuprea TaxID=62099 RepID=W6JPL1_9POXV|nr:FEN1-like nuclease [Anomala cuprea entomopoxvirus]BAO49469.1 FEN1-like nuclease [Anomala cuprea entomopoxvirus]